MKDFFVGLFAGAGLMFGVFLIILVNAYGDKLTECEKNLPRTENCVLVAVPEGVE